jgi:lipopolysaccharide/colanic/teichoic acid biosynthesis glycosyltransferase
MQERIGKDGAPFKLFKLRSMYVDSDKKRLQITVGRRDPRITRIGYYIRKYKIDELVQLINVLKGEMSLVGPRPEVKKYVDLYTPEQRIVLTVKPGITDYASIKYRNENELLENQTNPEKYYIDVIIPEKISLNLIFINSKEVQLYLYFKIIIFTIIK